MMLPSAATPYLITVALGRAQATFRLEPTKKISQLRDILPTKPKLPPAAPHLRFFWENQELDENKTFADYDILSGALFVLGAYTRPFFHQADV
jgi:hypothetical protein